MNTGESLPQVPQETGHNADFAFDIYHTENVLAQLRAMAALSHDEMLAVFANTQSVNARTDSAGRKDFIAEVIPKQSQSGKLATILDSLYEQTTGESTVHEFASAKLVDNHALPQPEIIDVLASKIEHRRIIEARSGDIVNSVEWVMEQDVKNPYIVAKVLAEHPGNTVDDKEHITVQDLVMFGSEFESNDLYGQLQRDTEAGLFDSYIAADILHTNRRDHYAETGKRTNRELSNMIALGQQFAPHLDERGVIDELCKPESLALWPAEARKLLTTAKADLATNLQQRFTTRRKFAYAHGFLVERATDTQLTQFLQMNQSLMMTQRGTGQLSKLERVQRDTRRRSGAKRSVGKTAVSKAARSPEKDAPVRTISMMNTKGESFDENSKQFQDMIDEYVSAHPEDDLRTTLDAALDYLRRNGLSTGIKPLSTSIKIGEDRHVDHKIYRFRPNLATGVSVSSRMADKMRIYFLIDKKDGSKINILGIMDKSNADRFYRKFGLKTRNGK